ncbi:hypothetical protein ATY30_18825 [Sinorhizobium americanum]|nr:hypothetical protein CO664_14420 [Sinorhizobium sp. NG07B]POH29644.1 hypothetical protein ATY30_18825 [Sinorhizobium americanum]
MDAAMVMAFVRAADVGLSGTELKPEIDGNAAVLARLEAVRGAVAVKLGLCVDPAEAASRTPALPKVAFVSTPRNHRVADGQKIASTQIDLIARGVSMGRLHHACIVETLRRPALFSSQVTYMPKPRPFFSPRVTSYLQLSSARPQQGHRRHILDPTLVRRPFGRLALIVIGTPYQ